MSTEVRHIDDGKAPDKYTDPDMREETEAVFEDAVEEIVPMMPIVLPVMGAVLIFLLAFIAVKMA